VTKEKLEKKQRKREDLCPKKGVTARIVGTRTYPLSGAKKKGENEREPKGSQKEKR